MRNPRHEANIAAKADRAVEAIDSLIQTRLIADPDFPEVTSLTTGRQFMLRVLDPDLERATYGELTVSAAMWVAVGIEHDRMMGHTGYGGHPNPAGPTQFKTSRQCILDTLDARVWIATQPRVTDPFAGLNGEAF